MSAPTTAEAVRYEVLRRENTRLQGEIEKQRIEAERRAQLEAMAKQQEHARQLEMIRQDEGKKKLRNIAIGVGAAAVLAIAGGTALVLNQRKEAEAEQARAREAQALGFKKIVMPASNTAGLERLLGVRAVGVRSVEEALDELF